MTSTWLNLPFRRVVLKSDSIFWPFSTPSISNFFPCWATPHNIHPPEVLEKELTVGHTSVGSCVLDALASKSSHSISCILAMSSSLVRYCIAYMFYLFLRIFYEISTKIMHFSGIIRKLFAHLLLKELHGIDFCLFSNVNIGLHGLVVGVAGACPRALRRCASAPSRPRSLPATICHAKFRGRLPVRSRKRLTPGSGGSRRGPCRAGGRSGVSENAENGSHPEATEVSARWRKRHKKHRDPDRGHGANSKGQKGQSPRGEATSRYVLTSGRCRLPRWPRRCRCAWQERISQRRAPRCRRR